MKRSAILIIACIAAVMSAIGQLHPKKPLPQRQPLPAKTSPSQPASRGTATPAKSSRTNDNHSSTSETLANSIGETVGEGMRTFANASMEAMSISVEGYPNVCFRFGMSRFAGEFVQLKWSTGGMGGLGLFTSVGKDWIYDLPNKNKLAWNVGFDIYFAWESTSSVYANNAFSFGLAFGETPIIKNYGVMTNFEYQHWFGETGRYGLFGSVGLGLGDTKDKNGKAIWDVSAGIAIKLWQR